MSTYSLQLQPSYGYVIIVAASSTLVNTWLGVRVTSYRKIAKVEYPNEYAEAKDAAKSMEKYQFNCAQRGHQNFLENYSGFLVTLLSAGVTYPATSAVLGAVYLAGKVAYALGYTRPVRDGGKGRYYGAFSYISTIGLLGLSLYTGYTMLA